MVHEGLADGSATVSSGAVSIGDAGRWTLNTVPLPTSLASVMKPPWLLTMASVVVNVTLNFIFVPRYGVLAQPVKLSDFKGKTVVLAFFFRARTKG